ncbi:MAG: ATP-grasp domain-containing protein [Myxococcota bacterium]
MKQNVFLIGLDELNRSKMRTLRQVRHDEVCIRDLLGYDETHGASEYPIDDMLRQAVRVLNDFPGPVDAITGFWDFPVSCMVPILCAKYGVRTASLESVLKCEHKYWSRVEQKKVVPEHVPDFQSFDPFDDQALSRIRLEFPFWIKPVKSFGSHLGFKIRNERDWNHAIPLIRANIGTFTDPLERVMELAQVPGEISEAGNACIAEQIIAGRQCTLEGYVHEGKVRVYGVVDSIRYANLPSFHRFQYPSKLPKQAQKQMIEVTKKLMKHLGYDNRTFNVEFFYDMKRDHAWLLEVNTRMAQSHADLFYKVDGATNHEILVDLACGNEPDFPHREGEFPFAAKMFVRAFRDGVVTHAPDTEAIESARRQFPGLIVQPMVEPGMRLSHLLYQDSYSYYVAILYMGAKNEKDLLQKYQKCVDLLHFHVADLGEEEVRHLPDLSVPAEESLQAPQ